MLKTSMTTPSWNAFCRRLLKKAQVCRSGSAKRSLLHERTLTLWFKWRAFPYCHSKTVSSKLDCLKSRLNPDRSCLAFSLETCTSSKTCAGKIIRALSPCYFRANVQFCCCIQIHEKRDEWMRRNVFCWQKGTRQRQKPHSGGGYQSRQHVALFQS